MKLIEITLKNSVISRRKYAVSIIKTSWLALLKEIISVYFENHTKRINTRYWKDTELVVHIVTTMY
jgi:hypothetical protein